MHGHMDYNVLREDDEDNHGFKKIQSPVSRANSEGCFDLEHIDYLEFTPKKNLKKLESLKDVRFMEDNCDAEHNYNR